MNHAVRRGLLSTNPVSVLTADERPTVSRREFRELGPPEIEKLLEIGSNGDYYPLIRTALYTGLRLAELLGLQWECVDLNGANIHVRHQWAREGALTEPKTSAAIRRVAIPPDLVQYLRKHKARSHFSTERDFVFASRTGTPLGHRNVCRAFTRIIKTAGLDDEPKLTFHGLRHIYASMMIERGISSTVLAGQMGHTSSTVTEQRYIHLFNRVRTDEAVRIALQQAMRLGKSLASAGGEQRETESVSGEREVPYLHGSMPTASH